MLAPPGVGDIAESEAALLLTRLENLAFTADYSEVKNDARWRRLYLHGNRPLYFRNAAGVEALSGNHATFPYHFCGIILPVGLIQVEHVMPKASAKGAAILKCLHSLGAALTTADAHGSKNRQANNIVAASGNPVAIAALAQVPVARQHKAMGDS